MDDWEGKVNAWPLDEGLIDYVDAAHGGPTDENLYAGLNVIANPTFTLSGRQIDATEITPALLEGSLHEADAVEANVATGYHAIEFLLWGQDLNGTGPGAGDRPWTDYAAGDACTGGNCDRRGQYLAAAADLLVSDLEWMAGQWAEDGPARGSLLQDPDAGIVAMLTGMGSLSHGEQAGERMKLGVLLNDPEEEHDCFSDNTHNSHFYDGLGIRNVYVGEYVRTDGTVVSGPSLSQLVAAADPAVDAALRGDLDRTMIELGQIKAAAEAGVPAPARLRHRRSRPRRAASRPDAQPPSRAADDRARPAGGGPGRRHPRAGRSGRRRRGRHLGACPGGLVLRTRPSHARPVRLEGRRADHARTDRQRLRRRHRHLQPDLRRAGRRLHGPSARLPRRPARRRRRPRGGNRRRGRSNS